MSSNQNPATGVGERYKHLNYLLLMAIVPHAFFVYTISIYFFNVFVCYASKSTTFLENFQNSRHKKNPGKSRFSEVLIVFCIRLKLSFRELRCSTSCFETVFLTFFHTWITSKESSCFKNWSVFCICFKKCS